MSTNENIDPDDDTDNESGVGVTIEINDTTAPTFAALPNGQGLLVLSGPETGTVVNTATGELFKPIPTRDDALSGNNPVMLVHHGTHCTDALPGVLARLHGAVSGNVAFGAVIDLPGRSADANQKALSNASAAALRIADPEGYRCTPDLISVNDLNAKQLTRAPYLADGAAKIADVLAAQRAAGANLLLTSGRCPNPSAATTELELLGQEGDDALALLEPGERLALNITITDRWLMDQNLRRDLLDFLLEVEQFDVWYIRVQFTESGRRSTEQPVREQLIRGYKRLGELAEDEDRILLLPNTGLTGWLNLAFGATGFGTGASGSKQGMTMQSGGGGGNPPLERYLEPTLLHAVESIEHRRLRTADTYTVCTCPYCGPWEAAGPWRSDQAGLHHIHRTGLLTETVLTGKSWRSSIRKRVTAAKATADELALTGASEPRHLTIWDQVL